MRFKPLCIVYLLLIMSITEIALAKPAKRARAKSKTEIKPELIYRQVQVGHRRGSVFYKDSRSSDFVDQLYVGMKFIKTYDYRFTVLVEPAFYTERDQATKEVLQIQQAYAAAQLADRFSLTAGRKIEYVGSGYFVNPSDLLNEDKNFIDPLEQRTGKNFTKFTFEADEFLLSLGYIRNLNNDFRDNKGWMQFEAYWFDADWMISQTYSHELKTTTGLSIAKFFTDSIELHLDARHQTTQRKEEEYSSYNAFEFEDDSIYYLLGTRYVLSHKRTFILEWIQNQSGLLKEELEGYHSELLRRKEAQAAGDTSTANAIPDPYTQLVGRRFLALGYFDEETVYNFGLKITYLTNLYDASAFITTEFKYKPAPIFSVAYAPSFFTGDPSSEFGQQPAHTAHYIVLQGEF